MPQMAPQNWLMLYSLFLLTFLLFNLAIYYSLKYKPKYTLYNLKKTNFYWKW